MGHVPSVHHILCLNLQESPMPDPSELFTNVYVKGFGVEVREVGCIAIQNESS